MDEQRLFTCSLYAAIDKVNKDSSMTRIVLLLHTCTAVHEKLGPTLAPENSHERKAKLYASIPVSISALQAVEERVAALQLRLAGVLEEQDALRQQREMTEKRLARAARLTDALGEEGLRWRRTAEALQACSMQSIFTATSLYNL